MFGSLFQQFKNSYSSNAQNLETILQKKDSCRLLILSIQVNDQHKYQSLRKTIQSFCDENKIDAFNERIDDQISCYDWKQTFEVTIGEKGLQKGNLLDQLLSFFDPRLPVEHENFQIDQLYHLPLQFHLEEKRSLCSIM